METPNDAYISNFMANRLTNNAGNGSVQRTRDQGTSGILGSPANPTNLPQQICPKQKQTLHDIWGREIELNSLMENWCHLFHSPYFHFVISSKLPIEAVRIVK